MEPVFFLKGLIIGVAMTAPPGPIGIMCMRKTLAEGHPRGFIIGLGAATADTLYGAVAAFGLTFVSDIIASQYFWLRLVGGALLLFLGVRTLCVKHKMPLIPIRNNGLIGSYLPAFVLALTNPLTIFAFVGLFAVFGLGENLVFTSASALVVGVFAGSCLWFLTLGYVTDIFGKKLNSDGLRWVHQLAGVLVIGAGIAVFVSVAYLNPGAYGNPDTAPSENSGQGRTPAG